MTDNNDKLENRFDSPEELIKSELFTITGVLVENYQVFARNGATVLGGDNPPSNVSGYITKTILSVKPKNESLPIKILNFYGLSSLVIGQEISALIPRCAYRKIPDRYPRYGNMRSYTSFYEDRDYKATENPIELNLVENDRVLRTERSVKYEDYFKK